MNAACLLAWRCFSGLVLLALWVQLPGREAGLGGDRGGKRAGGWLALDAFGFGVDRSGIQCIPFTNLDCARGMEWKGESPDQPM